LENEKTSEDSKIESEDISWNELNWF
jgi:hypothetical protein